MSLDFFWHCKDFCFLRFDFYGLLGVRKDATNPEIMSGCISLVNRIERSKRSDSFTKIFVVFLYDGMKILLDRKGRVYYDTFQELIRYPDECIDIKLSKKLNKKPQQTPKRFLISCKDEFFTKPGWDHKKNQEIRPYQTSDERRMEKLF